MFKLIGLIMALISFPVLFWNEGRAVKTAKSLEEGAAVVTHVDSSPVKESKEGKLVHFTGMASTATPLHDPVFNVEAKALQLSRKVEMYQWKEETDSNRATPSGDYETANGYRYKKSWSDQWQSSSNFKAPNGHQNPDAIPFKAETLNAADVTVGDYQIPTRVISSLDGDFTPWTMDDKAAEAAPAAGGPGLEKPKLDQGGFYYGKNPAEPQVGDVKVRFATKGLSEISVIGRQHGKTVEPYPTRVGEPVEMARVGSFAAHEMFDGAMKSNTVLTWGVRVGGFLLMFIGNLMLLRLRGLLRFIPFVGSAINAGAGVLAFSLASMASLATIGFAWLAYRPMLGFSLLILGGLAGWLLLRRPRQSTI